MEEQWVNLFQYNLQMQHGIPLRPKIVPYNIACTYLLFVSIFTWLQVFGSYYSDLWTTEQLS